jgi:hypothetical protein
LDKDAVCHQVYSTYTSSTFGDFKTGGQAIHTIIYADDLVLLAKEEMQNKGSKMLFASKLKILQACHIV